MFPKCSYFTHPHDYEELYFKIRKFIHDGHDYICIRQIQIDLMHELCNDLFFMRLEVENGGMPYLSPQLSNFEPTTFQNSSPSTPSAKIDHLIHSIPCKQLGNMSLYILSKLAWESGPLLVKIFVSC